MLQGGGEVVGIIREMFLCGPQGTTDFGRLPPVKFFGRLWKLCVRLILLFGNSVEGPVESTLYHVQFERGVTPRHQKTTQDNL